MRLADKTALVLGGTAGIGLGIVEAFVAEGASVIFTGRRDALGQEIANRLAATTQNHVSFRQLDVNDLEHLQQTIAETANEFGRLDVLVSNVGTALDRTILETTVDEFDAVFETNVRAMFFAMKWAAEVMIEKGGGSIVNTASTAGIRGLERRAAYCSSKGAVIQMSKAAALDLARYDVRVNCVSPGAVDTDLLRSARFAGVPDQDEQVTALGSTLPLGRIGAPTDIAQATVFLASDESSWITGSNIVVDGGATAR
jgi:NAD(P)-dependent dehydrogenase (short-subunit alcohol dehydrogenase family)